MTMSSLARTYNSHVDDGRGFLIAVANPEPNDLHGALHPVRPPDDARGDFDELLHRPRVTVIRSFNGSTSIPVFKRILLAC